MCNNKIHSQTGKIFYAASRAVNIAALPVTIGQVTKYDIAISDPVFMKQ